MYSSDENKGTEMKPKPIYRRFDQWVLGTCNECASLNYVEPHGTTADCKRCKRDTEHSNIPYDKRDMSGCWMVKQ
jgi:hypothetical protein